jgi:hypothetical protein
MDDKICENCKHYDPHRKAVETGLHFGTNKVISKTIEITYCNLFDSPASPNKTCAKFVAKELLTM